LTKKTSNSVNENVFYRAEKRYKNGVWGPAQVFGRMIEGPSKGFVEGNIEYYRKWKSWKTGRKQLSGRTRVVKITTTVKTHTTVVKEVA